MQILKTLSLTLVLSVSAVTSITSAQANNQTDPSAIKYTETPANTVIIKHPAANDPATFFATNTVFMFEVYKPGDVAKLIATIKKDSNVQECTEGSVNGDYHQLHLVLKTTKEKQWFAAFFKKVGLTTIKINNNPIVEVEKM